MALVTSSGTQMELYAITHVYIYILLNLIDKLLKYQS